MAPISHFKFVSTASSMCLCGVLLSSGLATVSVQGASLTILNHSFEDQVIPRDHSPLTATDATDDWIINTAISGWIDFDDGRGAGLNTNRGLVSHAKDSFHNIALGTTPESDANDQSFSSAEKDIYQVLAATLEADTAYTLQVDIGERLSGKPGNPRIYLGYGTTPQTNYLITLENTSQPVQVNRGWVTWSGQFTTGDSPAGLGQALRIELTKGNNVGCSDIVRLSIRNATK